MYQLLLLLLILLQNNISDLVKKTDYDAKISHVQTKYFTKSDYDIVTGKTVNAQIKEKGLVINNFELDKKIVTLAIKAKLKAEQYNLMNVQVFDSSYCRGKTHFKVDSMQTYLVFQSDYRYFKNIANSNYISTWTSKRLSYQSIKTPV